jgi:hypothetical protein
MPGACMGHAAKLGAAVTGGAGVVREGVKQDSPLVRFLCSLCRRLSYGGHDWHTCHDCRMKAKRKARF